MTTPFLIPPKPAYVLPISLGDDLSINFKYKPLVVDGSGNPVLDAQGNKQYALANYPSGSSVILELDTDTPITATATITGASAAVSISHSVADTIPKGTVWRVKLVLSGGGTQVLANGKTIRKDH